MQLACPHCQQVLQFSGKRPAFCAYCGKPLPSPAEDVTVSFDGAAPAAEQDADADPSEVGGYRLLRRIGEGGMGRVYEAEEAASGRRVAVKLISAEYAATPATVERFRREGRLASGVSHPRCVFVLAADEAGGRPYIVMELMPGTTLQDVVDREGPLPVEKALPRILDVIEGLREAHRLGVVHRDVKPSNCFLDAEGRVKVGDFGLAKSLVASDALTRTGTFIGTPLFASPEQIKGGEIGPQSDVYSTAATLYCLLTGKAPFQGGDPAATLARIVSDPAPPMRSLRRDLPEALDRAVLRGLERDPARRWRDLDEFHAALLPFVPGRLSIGGLGVRFGAFLVDYVFLAVLTLPLVLLSVALTGGGSPWDPHIRLDRQLLQMLMGLAMFGLYFGGCEALWGCTPGKRWLGLRVWKGKVGERPSAATAALRTGLFFLLLNLGTLALEALILSGSWDPSNPNPEQQMRFGLFTLAFYPLEALGIVLLLCTMRARSGYRGLHEVLSGTRVVLLPEAVRRRAPVVRSLELETTPPEGVPGRIGPFEVLGVLPGGGRGRLLLGNDTALGRRAWIWVRPADDPPLGAARRDLNRTTRPRWLAGGREESAHREGVTAAPAGGLAGQWQWDAFLAPDGGPLPLAVAAGPLSWGEARQLLTQLADELALAEADGTLPAALSAAQVWLWPDGRAQLLDVPVGAADDPTDASPPSQLALLARTAVLALEGKPRRAKGRPAGVRAPLPRYAADILGRLLGVGKPYPAVREFRAALTAAADRPAEATRPRRLAYVAVLMMLLSCGLCSGLGPTAFFPPVTAGMIPMRIRQMEKLHEPLRQAAEQDAAEAKAAEPWKRPFALQNAQEDARLDQALTLAEEHARREHQARLDALDWTGRSYAQAFEKQMEDVAKQPGYPTMGPPPGSPPSSARMWAQMDVNEEAARGTDENRMLGWIQTVLVLFWPAVWVVWAFLFRGGLSYPLMGLALVRRNGRPALRVQCAWRALLVWAPVTGLVYAAIWLEASYWTAWYGDGAQLWMLWASSAAWWAALALLPLYAAVAVWFPKRGPHDWLAGTYVVPR